METLEYIGTIHNKISGVIVLNYPAFRMKKETGCFSRLENILSLNNFKMRDAQLIPNTDHDFFEKIQIMLQTCQIEGIICFTNAIDLINLFPGHSRPFKLQDSGRYSFGVYQRWF